MVRGQAGISCGAGGCSQGGRRLKSTKKSNRATGRKKDSGRNKKEVRLDQQRGTYKVEVEEKKRECYFNWKLKRKIRIFIDILLNVVYNKCILSRLFLKKRGNENIGWAKQQPNKWKKKNVTKWWRMKMIVRIHQKNYIICLNFIIK